MPTSARPRVALATCARLPDLWTDDQVLAAELRRRDLVEVATPAWDDEAADWGGFDLVVIRNTWDYWHRRDQYVAWADRVAAASTLLNPAPVVRWNTHKGYLRELEAAGVPVVPTAWLAAGGTGDIATLMAERGWADAVVKPAVSAAADDTARTSTVGVVEAQLLVDRVLARRDVMVQPYVEAVDTTGERSLLYVDGALTHAVRRPPYLSTGIEADSVAAEPAPDEIEVAEQVLDAVPGGAGQLLYARVDLIRDAAGAPMLMEVELVEPQLFFALSADATLRMANAIEARAGSAGRSTTSGS
jgi:glutathione synthase/RimK-type ligase-like ATP-grasp enzyme